MRVSGGAEEGGGAALALCTVSCTVLGSSVISAVDGGTLCMKMHNIRNVTPRLSSVKVRSRILKYKHH